MPGPSNGWDNAQRDYKPDPAKMGDVEWLNAMRNVYGSTISEDAQKRLHKVSGYDYGLTPEQFAQMPWRPPIQTKIMQPAQPIQTNPLIAQQLSLAAALRGGSQ